MKLITQHFINNEFVNSIDGDTFETVDPSTEKVLVSVQRAKEADVDVAVQAAKAAFYKWRDVSGPDRRDLLLKLSDLIQANKQCLAEWESKDNGKPVSTARDVDIALSVKHLRYFAGWADKIQGKTIPTESNASTMAMTIHEPVGVVGCIIPWNFPILMMMWKLAPLLACGCTTVLKTSEKTPLTALMICDLIKEAGFPAGVVNVLSGFGPDCGAAIAKHPSIDKVAFTGSSAVGRTIVKYSAESNLKRVTLELGGKSALIICDDADLDKAAEIAHVGLFLNQGQCCCASSRILVDEKVHDVFAQKCVDRLKSIKLGTGEGMDQGPQVDKIQFDKVMNYIKSGKEEGATCVNGGKRATEVGYYIEPTIFTDVKDEMTIAKEEIFGPVMQLMKVSNFSHVVVPMLWYIRVLTNSFFNQLLSSFKRLKRQSLGLILVITALQQVFAPWTLRKRLVLQEDLMQVSEIFVLI
jgi:aldehyde dehydrogenase (NAD+)